MRWGIMTRLLRDFQMRWGLGKHSRLVILTGIPTVILTARRMGLPKAMLKPTPMGFQTGLRRPMG